jgi:hypothetical protein
MVLVPIGGLRTFSAVLAALVFAVGLGAVRLAPADLGDVQSLGTKQVLLALPASAQGTVSADLGRVDPRYRVFGEHGVGSANAVDSAVDFQGLHAANPVQGFALRFSRTGGVMLSSGRARFTLVLAGVGRGTRLLAPPASAARAVDNRISYDRGGLREWYVNGPLGLEQGFDLARRPAGGGVLTLAVRLSGASSVRVRDGEALVSGGDATLRYRGLWATDARGHTLRAWLGASSGRLLIHVDDRGARYPIRIDPFIQQGETMRGGSEVGKGEFGYSVALSAEGDTALVGGPQDTGGVGAVWVFVRSGTSWTQQGEKLTAGEEDGSGEFGSSVALSADGDTALIGAPADDHGIGAAWVFTRSDGVWTQQGGKLTGAGESGAGLFGASVALAAGGETALIGGPEDSGGVGAAWVFGRSGEVWGQQAEITGTDEVGKGLFGAGVALSAEGSTALIGGPGDDGEIGAAWVFTRSGASWTQQGSKLIAEASDVGPSGLLGLSVSLSSDGNTALIGAPGRENEEGSAWVFTRSPVGIWIRDSRLAVQGRETLGLSVSLSGEGDVAVLSGSGESGIWEFELDESRWSDKGEIASGSASLAISSDASTLLTGGPANDAGEGMAAVLANVPQVESVYPKRGPASGGTQVTIDGEDFAGATAVVFGSTPAPSFTVDSSREITATTPPGSDGVVHVTVVNSVGTSNTNFFDEFTYGAPQGSPTNVHAKAGEGEATVTFEDAGKPGTEWYGPNYTVTASPGGVQASDSLNSITVPGLTDGVKYTFTVTATDEFGTSAPSAPSNAVVPGQIGLDASKRLDSGAVEVEVGVPGQGQLSGVQAVVAAGKASATAARVRHKPKQKTRPRTKPKAASPSSPILVRPTTMAAQIQESSDLVFEPTVAALRELTKKQTVTVPVEVSFTGKDGHASAFTTNITFTRPGYSFESSSELWSPAWGTLTTALSSSHTHSGRYSLQITVHNSPYSAVDTTESGDGGETAGPMRLLQPGVPISMWVYRPSGTPPVGFQAMVRVGSEWTECRGPEVKPRANRWVRLSITVPSSVHCKGPSEPNVEVHGVGVEIDDKHNTADGKSVYLDDVSW